MAPRKVIISCAVTGGIHTPTMSPYLPITPEQIAESGVAAAEAGASILHLHARDPENGRPTASPDAYMRFLPEINERSDAIINITTGGGLGMSLDERLAAARVAQPEMCSLNMGSINFGLYPMKARYSEWKHSWEPEFLDSTRDLVFKNTFTDIENIVTELGGKYGTKFEFECYDVGHLYNLAHFVDRGVIKGPVFIQTIFGIHGGMGAEIDNLLHMHRTAERLFGAEHEWSVIAAGRNQLPFGITAASLGGSVRVGLEDNLFISRGKLAESNAQQVLKLRRILEDLSLEVATPDEARTRLGLKGSGNVAF